MCPPRPRRQVCQIACAVFAAALVACAASPRAREAGDALAQIQRYLAQREYWASANERGLQAPNRAHGLRTWFEPDGIRVVDRETPASPQLLGLRFDAWGREGALSRARAGELRHANERVEIRRPGVVEWFVNGPQGLEHGFTVDGRPEGDGALRFQLAAHAARARLSGDAVLLDTTAGRTLRYGNLAAYDATRRKLDAHFEVPSPDLVELVIADAGAVYPVTIDPLLSTSAARRESDQGGAFLGASVASAGDVNADGYVDVIVGAPAYDAGDTDEGAAFVFLGGPSGIGSGGVSNAHARLEGDQAGARLGTSVSSAGDANGDGYADVIVGAYRYDAGQTDEGAAFVFLGSASGIVGRHAAEAHARLESDQASAYLGVSVSSAGDVNGDDYADVIAGAYSYDAGEANEGAAFIFRGSASGIVGRHATDAHARLESDKEQAQLGYSVSSAGDVNGDGYSDVIAGAWFYTSYTSYQAAGAAFVFLGSAAGIADGHAAAANARIVSIQHDSLLGSGVASAGDVNGDGYADVIVGAPFYTYGETYEGAAFVFLGSASGIGSHDASEAAAQLESDDASANFGTSVSTAGDVNGDGYADVIVGAPYYTGGGAAFVFLGSASGTGDRDASTAFRTISSGQSNAHFGISVSSAGDVDGDGASEVVVGAHAFDAGEDGEGLAFVPEPGALPSLVAGTAALLALRRRKDAVPHQARDRFCHAPGYLGGRWGGAAASTRAPSAAPSSRVGSGAARSAGAGRRSSRSARSRRASRAS